MRRLLPLVAASLSAFAGYVLVVALAMAANSAQVSIVEPPFKPPATWTYLPAALTVRAGTTVTWINTGAVVHTVTADDGRTFNSGDIAPNASFSFTPRAPGEFAYHGVYHPWMKGTFVVR